MAPLIVAVMPIGLVFGAVAATKGLSSLEVVMMSALVFAGGSQFVALDIWTHPASWAALGFSALLVNIRHLLMSASIGTKMPAFSGPARYAAMLLLADEIWAMAEVRAGESRLTPAWYAGLAVPFYLAWVLAGLAGPLAGAFLGDPKALGLDFLMAVIAPTALVTGPAETLAALATALVATRLPLLAAVAAGVIVVAVARVFVG
ncbi:branched-chain amino acid ABC transporter permease [Sinorhizobium meliloti]|nr:branched-chain amino acid ABC transporter permease [Sinorhizobium meliloti]MDX0328127.1 branched-chain amino acid ABC transporter permease [Sinorhizobium meliloti]